MSLQTRPAIVLLVWSCFLAFHMPSAAAQTPEKPPPGPADFARFVPNNTNFFLTINKPLETDRAMRRANAWPFMALLAGLDLRQARDVGLHDAVSAFLGPESTIRADDLLQMELGFATNAWTEIGGAVWLVRLQDPSRLAQWFPHQASATAPASRPLHSFRTQDGLRVLHGHGVLAMGRRVGKDSLLRHCALLLLHRTEDGLRATKDYQNLVSYLPARALATAYMASTAPGPVPAGTSPFLPGIRKAVIGLYERAERFELAIRAMRSNPVNADTVSQDTFTRFIRLPQDTVVAAATTLPRERLQALIQTTFGRFIPRAATADATGKDEPNPFEQLEPQIILAAGRTAAASDASPQLAVMIRCSNSNLITARISRLIDDFLDTVKQLDPGNDTAALEINRDSHLGVPVYSVSLAPIVDATRLPSLTLFANYEPAWASWGNWLILALDRDHIKHIVDAQYGLTPRIAGLPNVQRMNFYAAERSTIAVIQPDLASDVVAQWLENFDAGRASLLDPDWWELPNADENFLHDRLGIVLANGFEPGVVTVGEVLPDMPAAGGIQAGDRIVGVDSVLLDLDYPEASLRRIHERGTHGNRSTIRVLREGEMLEVTLAGVVVTEPETRAGPRPDDAFRKLLAVLRTLKTAEFEVHSTRDRDYSAKLTLSFAKP